LGRRDPVRFGLAALAGLASVVVVPLALRRIAAKYGEEPLATQAAPRPAAARTPRRSWLARLGAAGLHGPARGGFDLAWANPARDRTLKMAMVPMLIMPIAMMLVPMRGEAARL